MSLAMHKEEWGFTYADYLTWPDNERWEIIDGKEYNMSPAPTFKHQEISVELSRQFANFLFGKPCRAIAAPFDVILPEASEAEEKVETVVQPDIVVICDRKKITKRGCVGAPDLVIEILSPRTAKKDMTTKLELYRRMGVREYWMVEPDKKWVRIYTQDKKGRLIVLKSYSADDKPEVGILPGLVIELPLVFAEME